MPSFAPVYRVPASQLSFLTREQKRERKRKRDADADADADTDGSDHSESDDDIAPVSLAERHIEPRVLRAVNRKDQYYVAGWSREEPLSTTANFPHAPLKETPLEPLSVEAQLARSNPPIYAPKQISDHPSSSSLRRRHLDNLTAILHKCMLKQDWQRAARAWALILRTSIDGNGPDVRQHGHWMLGAELLMRKDQTYENQIRPREDNGEQQTSVTASVISDEAFKLAREYYERLILQYPHRHNTPPSAFSARVVYPALFNVWVFEVQNRSRRAQMAMIPPTDSTSLAHLERIESNSSDQQRRMHQVKTRELAEAGPISERLEELLLSPPYDTMAELLELKAMISLWLCDIHETLADYNVSSSSDTEEDTEPSISISQHQMKADQERAKAVKMLQSLWVAGLELSDVSLAILEEEHSKLEAT